MVWDRSVHLADLTEALGRPVPSPATWQPVLASVRDSLADLVDGTSAGADPVSDYELFRAAFSRRSQRQLAQLFPHADCGRLATIGIFGPRLDDQPVP